MFCMKCVLWVNIKYTKAIKHQYNKFQQISTRTPNCFKLTATLTYLLLVPLDKICDCKIQKNACDAPIKTVLNFTFRREIKISVKIHVSHFKRLVSFYMENKGKILQFRKYGLDYERSKMPLMSHLKKHQMFGRPNFLSPPAYFLSTHQPHFFST